MKEKNIRQLITGILIGEKKEFTKEEADFAIQKAKEILESLKELDIFNNNFIKE